MPFDGGLHFGDEPDRDNADEPKPGILHRQFVISLAVIVVSQALFVLAVLWIMGAL